ncbi:MAG TPA: D-alanyl-D-alanine carboxypeptidase family protein, partial [Afifellaceae bacterium]|nr:D-alanyl-D-alanine carboxypeptidase family protein [Afifellaceae bacterium]
ALLVDAASGRVLHAHEIFRPWHPASLTKLMTLYAVFAAMEAGRVAPETPVPVSARAAAEPFNNTGWPVGTQIALEQAIPLLVVKSANDLAVAVAETVAGDLGSFIAEMNATAQRLGMSGTGFINSNGIHAAGQVTTARDLALLSAALIRDFPQHRHHFAADSVVLNGETVASPNRLIGRFPGADGMKTGYLCASGWNIVASASRGGRTLLAVVLGALREGEREEIAAKLLETGFTVLESGPQAGPTLADLEPPAAPAEPVDMRPYACEGRRPPAALASFGLEGAAPLPRPKP